MSKSWGDVKTRPSLLSWPPEVVILQCDVERAEELLARARTDEERGVALRAVGEAAAHGPRGTRSAAHAFAPSPRSEA
jgi:hypothetical protein